MAEDISVIVGAVLMAIGGLLVTIGLVLCYTTKVPGYFKSRKRFGRTEKE